MKKIHLIHGTIYLTISSLIIVGVGYLLNIWLGRSLGPEKYGIYGVVISLISNLSISQSSGIPHAVTKYSSEGHRNPESVLSSGIKLQMIIASVCSFLFFFFAKDISNILNDSSLIPLIQISAFSFPLYGLFSLYIGYYNGLHRFNLQALMSIFYGVGKGISVVILTVLFGLTGSIIGFILSPAIGLITGFRFPNLFRESFSYKKILMFAIPILIFTIFSTFQNSIDLYFVKALSTSDKNPGYYTASQNISRIIFFSLNAFALVLFPSISRSLSLNQTERIRTLIHKSLRMILILLVPGTFLIAVTSAQIIHLLYSTVYLPAAPSLSVLIFGIGFLTVFTVLANILNGAGEPKKSLWISALGVTLTAFFCWFLIPKYGLVGAALSTTIGSFVSMVIATYFVYQRFHALVPAKSVIKIIFASLIIYFMAKIITIPLLVLPILYIFLFAVYVGILIILKEVTLKDWKQVKSLIPSWVPFVNNVVK